MVDARRHTSGIVLDAAPVIYLAKVDALEVLEHTSPRAYAPPSVIQEATRPAIALRHPDAVAIEMAVGAGIVVRAELTSKEVERAGELAALVPGLHAGECDVLALALTRNMPAVIFERRARRVAQAVGVTLVDVVELLFAGTSDPVLLEERLRRFARLVEMRLAHLESLLVAIGRRIP